MKTQSIPGKIILFGEYTILIGSRALAIPLHQYSGSWAFKNESPVPYHDELKAFANYLLENADLISFTINTDAFLKDLEQGLFFDSNIPIGYGAGSSGAIVAGVCLKYSDLVIDKLTDLSALKVELGIMENYFHGASSGIDPLISLLNKPILIKQNKEIAPTKIPALSKESNLSFFLLDTGLTRQTGPLVEIFKTKIKDEGYERRIIQQLIPENNKAIDQLLNSEFPQLQNSFQNISQFQFEYFQEMIPEFIKEKWKHGLASQDYFLKLCGAGGGGFILGMTRDFEMAQNAFTPLRVSLLEI